MQAILDICAKDNIAAETCLAVTHKTEAYGITRAEKAGVDVQVIDHDKNNRAEFENKLDQLLRDYEIDYILLAGFMRILSAEFVEKWPLKIINIHPSLLPAFPGLNTHQKALDYGVKYVGCTVHFVTAELDDGPILAQEMMAVQEGDTAETLAERLLPLEHQCYQRVVGLLAEGALD